MIENKSWSIKFHNYWEPGSNKAKEKLEIFKSDALHDYNINRDIPSIEGTSKLSPHLRFGEISPKEVLNSINHIEENDGINVYKSENLA